MPIIYTMEAKSLMKALRLLCKVVRTERTIPILQTVLIDASDGHIRLSATDLDNRLSVNVLAPDVTGFWSARVNARDLLKIVSTQSGPVTLEPIAATVTCYNGFDNKGEPSQPHEVDAARLKIGATTLPGFAPSAVPLLQIKGEPVAVNVDAESLADCLRFVQHAASTEETRYYLNGVYFDGARVAATDGRRMAVADWLAAGKADAKGIMPRAAVALILATLEPGAKLEIVGTQYRLLSGPHVLAGKLIDGSFPPYERVIPSDNPHKLTVDREALATKVKSVAAIHPSGRHATKAVSFNLEPNSLTVWAKNLDGAESAETLACDYAGPPLIVSFNSSYVLDAIAAFKGDSVTIALGGAPNSTVLEPTLVTDAGGDAKSARKIVLMPLSA
jgi:DNA polymerase-3 subunit beta